MPHEHETVMMELRKVYEIAAAATKDNTQDNTLAITATAEVTAAVIALLRHAPLLLSLAEEGIKAREWVKDAHDCTGDDGHVHGHDNNAKMDAAQAAWNEAIKRTDSLTQKKEDRTDG